MAKRKPLAFDGEQLTQDLKQSSGQGMGAFFSPQPKVSQEEHPSPVEQGPLTIDETPPPEPPSERSHKSVPPRHRDTTVSWSHATMVETVRKAVKQFGKEAATHRFTLEEKQALAEIIFTYKNHQVKTSENEIARIAINFILQDYHENGENSLLHQVLEALHV